MRPGRGAPGRRATGERRAEGAPPDRYGARWRARDAWRTATFRVARAPVAELVGWTYMAAGALAAALFGAGCPGFLRAEWAVVTAVGAVLAACGAVARWRR